MAVACLLTSDFPWFALSVKPLREKYVGSVLAGKGFTQFVPLYRDRRRWSDRVKEIELPLFPGYLFCRLDLNNRLPVLVTPFVNSIVGTGKTPIPVQDSEIEAIRTIVTSGQDALPWNYLPADCTARIEEGPLRGLEGVLIEVNKQHRLVVSVTLLQRSVAVEVERSWLTPVRPPIRVHQCSSVALQEPAPMSVFTRRTRTVSFRLSEEEYQELRQVCIAHGIRSMSDFARLTTQWWIDADGTHTEPLLATIRELTGRLRELDAQVKQLSGRTPSRDEENLHLQVRAAAGGK